MQIQKRRGFELRLSKAGVVLFTVGVSFLLLIAFVLGVVVGKNIETYPQKITGAIPGLIREKIAATPVPTPEVALKPEDVPEASKDGGQDVKLTFFDNLAGKKEGKEDVPRKVSEEKPAAAVKPVVAEKPALPALKEKPVSQEASPSEKNFILRVASLKDGKKAQDLQKTLSHMGYQSTLESRDVDSKGKFYRVNIIGFGTKDEAEKAAEMVKKKTNLNCLVANGK
jgi:cell division septation protein DedD